MNTLTLNILMSIFMISLLQIPTLFLVMTFKNTTRALIIYEILVIITTACAFVYFQYIR